MMRKLDINKLAVLPTANAMLDKKYGQEGSESRSKFDVESKEWYEGQLSGSYRITMPKSLHASLSTVVKQKGISISDFVNQLIVKELNTTR